MLLLLYYYITINIFRSSSIDAIIFNCGSLLMNISRVLEDFFGGSKIPPII